MLRLLIALAGLASLTAARAMDLNGLALGDKLDEDALRITFNDHKRGFHQISCLTNEGLLKPGARISTCIGRVAINGAISGTLMVTPDEAGNVLMITFIFNSRFHEDLLAMLTTKLGAPSVSEVISGDHSGQQRFTRWDKDDEMTALSEGLGGDGEATLIIGRVDKSWGMKPNP